MNPQESKPFAKSSAPLYHDLPKESNSSNIQQSFENEYDVNTENLKTTRVVKYGSILLFIGTVFVSAFFLADLAGGAVFYGYNNNASSHNSNGETFSKVLLLIINAVLLIMSGVFGLMATSNTQSSKSKYSLLHIAFLSLGMFVFIGEIVYVHVSFFTTGYDHQQFNSYSHYFLPFLIVFTILSLLGLLCCGACCVSGIVRYRNINANFKEVSI